MKLLLTLLAAVSLLTCSYADVSSILVPNGSAKLSVVSDGTPPLSYQWRKDGVLIPGATLVGYTATVAGTYDVVVSNAAGSAISDKAILTLVQPPTAPRQQPPVSMPPQTPAGTASIQTQPRTSTT